MAASATPPITKRRGNIPTVIFCCVTRAGSWRVGIRPGPDAPALKCPDFGVGVPPQDKASPAQEDEQLLYAVELWDAQQVEKILARALTMSLARAIFRAALEE